MPCRAKELALVQMKATSGKEVHALKTRRKPKRDTKPRDRSSLIECGRLCGRRHEMSKGKCTAYGQQCKKCGKENHSAAKYKQKENISRQKKLRYMHYVCEREERDEAEYCFTISLKNQVNTLSNHLFKSMILATMKVEGKPVRFQVDSGATCNILTRKDLQSNCKIERTEHRLTMYNRTDMKVTGKCLVESQEWKKVPSGIHRSE